MPAVQQYHRAAFDCLELAQATRDPEVREQMVRLAEVWARLAARQEDRTEHEPQAA
jgi:hypothetical protein